MRSTGWSAFALAIALSASVSAGEMYKCVTPTGKTEFRDTPCESKSAAQKVEVKPNSVGSMEPGEAAKKLEELNKKIADRNKAEDDQRVRDLAVNADFFEFCRGHAEEIYRQQPLTYHAYAPTRAAAVRSIEVERKRMADAGCPGVNVRALVNSR